MTEAGAALAVADHDQRGETEALAALHGLGDAVDVDELLDQLLAAVIVAATAATAIVATATRRHDCRGHRRHRRAATAAARTAALAGLALGTPLRQPEPLRPAEPASAASSPLRGGRFDLRGFVFVSHLELQSAFAGGIGQGFHPAMEQEAAAVEHDRRHARLLGALGQGLADLGSAIAGRAGLALADPCPASRPTASVLPAASSMTWA